MKYAPITSVDIESSFSTYKNIVSDNRVSFTTKNLGK
ncbi:Dimer Tnp hAT domain-containing protein [Aphis craccivora]|uniref:Dimer Tnp hAT domain-containing protein n=1 Tax=Aphis craccivora TaxID=307492 RepID=A0A6G0YI72_APHCR|nr:Dimer Tnp hAT domain-containing protein [Aphis craccivora]